MELKDKKILMVTTTDNMIWQFLIPHIQHLQTLGATVECVCARTGFWFDELKDKYGFTMHEIGFKRSPIHFANLKGYKKLKKLQNEKHFDLVYCQQPVGGLMGRLIAKKYKLPCIYTAHGFHFYKGCPIKNTVVFKTIEKWLSKYTTALVTINEEDYQSALKMKAKKVFKINGIGVDLSKYAVNTKLDKAEFKKSIGLNSDDFVVTSVGELNKNKNTFRLIKVFSEINNPKIKYVICGQGPLKDKYVKAINKFNLQDRVIMLGFRKDIPDIFAVSDLYVMPSYREGLSKSMMEAMCYGLPVVASNIRGNSDLVGNNEGGILVSSPTANNEFKNAIELIASDKTIYDRFRQRNLNFIKNYDINVVSNQLDEIYKEM